MSFRTPADGYVFPPDLMNPPVMAIGDSMYNGMRSATINAEFAARSVPASVARVVAPDAHFRAPRYPEVLLVDIERAFREIDLGDVFDRFASHLSAIVANGVRWGEGAHVIPAEHLAWDNLSQAGARIEDLTTHDWGWWDAKVTAELPKLRPIRRIDDLLSSDLDIIGLHMGLNGRFMLNPNDRDELRAMRPVDLVNLRKPELLLVNVGANHGLIDITLRGRAEAGLAGLRNWAEGMTDLAGMLTALGPETTAIFVNTIPLPSTVPNVMPPYNPGEVPLSALELERGYYPVYDNRLGGLGDYTHFTRAEMRDLDREVTAIIKRMIANMQAAFDAAGDDRLRIFRLDRALRRYDGKHVDAKSVRKGRPGVRLEHPRRTYTNKAIDFDNLFIWDDFREGGLGSLDNHHPSGLGYAVLTRELLREMKKTVPGIDLGQAMISEQGDRLFSDAPGDYATVMRLLYLVRRRKAGLRGEPDLDEARGLSLPTEPGGPEVDDKVKSAEAMSKLMNGLLRGDDPTLP